jgi:hypothetical protein
MAMHGRVRKLRGKADHCSRCGQNEKGVRYAWASLTGNYADPYDYEPMCPKCHRAYDAASYPTGERHHSSKLTDAIVREARMRYKAGKAEGVSSVTLAKEYGVSQSVMHAALTGKTWKHVA